MEYFLKYNKHNSPNKYTQRDMYKTKYVVNISLFANSIARSTVYCCIWQIIATGKSFSNLGYFLEEHIFQMISVDSWFQPHHHH